MTVADATFSLTETARALIDTRLDTIDRMLLGRVSRADRLAIVRDVEAQIHEYVEESGSDELDRDQILAVLARLDPPEAYVPEEGELMPVESRITVAPRGPRYARREQGASLGRLAGIMGILGAVAFLGYPLAYALAILTGSEAILFGVWCLVALGQLVLGLTGLVLGLCSRPKTPMAVAGISTGAIDTAIALSFGVLGGFFMLMGLG